MARKKRKVHHHKRRKMHGPVTPAQKNVLMMFAGAVTGAVGKRFIDTAISKQTAITLSDTMKKGINLGEFVGGGVLAYAMKNPFLQGLGIGLAVEGGTGLLAQMNVISGVGEA